MIPHKKGNDKLEFEPWPHVTRFEIWKTSLRRDVITGSTQLRRVTDWLAEIDQAKSMQDFDDVSCIRRLQDEFLRFPNCERPHEDDEASTEKKS